MPTQTTLERARQARRRGKAPTTQAGAFVREEIEHVRRGRHGARSTKQAIAIGLDKARRAGVALEPPRRGKVKTRRTAAQALRRGRARGAKPSSPGRARAARLALRREGRRAASRSELSRQARATSRRRRTPARRRARPGEAH